MSDVASGVYICHDCGAVAGSIELSMTPEERLCVRVVGPVAETRYFLDAIARPRILDALRREGAQPLYQVSPDYAPFYCPDCAKNYCRNCWQATPLFDDDFPGWYDCTEGICPQGHRRILDD